MQLAKKLCGTVIVYTHPFPEMTGFEITASLYQQHIKNKHAEAKILFGYISFITWLVFIILSMGCKERSSHSIQKQGRSVNTCSEWDLITFTSILCTFVTSSMPKEKRFTVQKNEFYYSPQTSHAIKCMKHALSISSTGRELTSWWLRVWNFSFYFLCSHCGRLCLLFSFPFS